MIAASSAAAPAGMCNWAQPADQSDGTMHAPTMMGMNMTATESAKTTTATAVSAAEVPGPASQRLIAQLRELVTALDRRVPHLKGTVEDDIARDAAALRDKARERIAELERSRE